LHRYLILIPHVFKTINEIKTNQQIFFEIIYLKNISEMPESGSSSSEESGNDSQQVERVQPLVEEGGAVCRVVIPGKLYAKPLFAQILYNFLG